MKFTHCRNCELELTDINTFRNKFNPEGKICEKCWHDFWNSVEGIGDWC